MSNKLDITSTVIEKGIDSVKGFLDKLIGPAIDEVGLLFGDSIRLWRFKNQIKILEKAQKSVKDRNLDTKIIAVKTLVPLLEYSSLEEDESLQDMWANLFVNYIDAKQKHESSVYPYILSQLSRDEVDILRNFIETPTMHYSQIKAPQALLANLVRLGVLKNTQQSGKLGFLRLGPESEYNSVDFFHLTPLGKEFIECCSPRE